jgi:hypothetical protein
MMRVVQAAMPQPRNTGTTVTTGGIQVAMLARNLDGVLPNHMLGIWVGMRPGPTLSPALPQPCQRRVSLDTLALLNIYSHLVLLQHTIMPLTARRAPDRPILGLLHLSQSQNPRHSHSCKAGRQLQYNSSPSYHHPGRYPQGQHHASHRRNSSSSSSSSNSNSKVLGSNFSRLHHRLDFSSRASQVLGVQSLLPASQQGSLSQVP